MALGYTAVVIAAVTFYFDYRLGWDKTKGWTLWAVVAYFILNSGLTYWIWAVEKGKVFVGEKNGAQVWEAPAYAQSPNFVSFQFITNPLH